MSNNTRIQRAVLINWKGMFFQPFDIDSGMTILEGANGTGKTTIMIAIYTCLIPDLNFLNFQNVTTVSSRRNEDKGLYGRIGQDEHNREEPIFSVLDIVTSANERHLVGVQLIKKTYPQVSLKHFAVSNLSPDVDIEKLLLRHNLETNQQEIPELDEIGEACKKVGGELVNFRHAKDYFQFMFEKDISPIRLIENEERKKYNQLLHTSLYGGLSRSLQTSLRDYLLPENDKLVQGINEMEHNLKTCRRTRSAIQRYQSVREIIRQVYDTGLSMYSSAFFATRLEAEQKLKKALQLRAEKRELKLKWDACENEIAAIHQQQLSIEEALEKKNDELDLARQRLNRCLEATKISREFKSKETDYQAQLEIEKSARSDYEALKAKEIELQKEQRSLNSQQMELAKQLSDAGKAWQELSKQVGLYQQAEKLLTEAQSLLNSKDLAIEAVAEELKKSRQDYHAAKDTHQKLYFELSDASLKQDLFENYFKILSQLSEQEILPEEAGDKASLVVEELSALEDRIVAADQLPEKIGRLKESIQNRDRLQQALKTADLLEINSREKFDVARETLLSQLKERKAELKTVQETIESQTNQLRSITDQLPALERQLNEWDRYKQIKKDLEDRAAVTIDNTLDLSNLNVRYEDQLQQLNLEKYDLKSRQKRIQRSYNYLISEKSTHPELKKLAEQGYGTLLADRYEEIPADWSANLESRLGPLSNSLVVKNVHKTANELAGSFDLPENLWLVEETHQEKMPEAVEMNNSILVKHGDAWRLSRLPSDPVLGKEARLQQTEKLAARIKEISKALEENDLKIKHIKENQTLANKLAFLNPDGATSSPLDRIKELSEQQKAVETKLKKLEDDKTSIQSQLDHLEEKEDTLRQYYPLRELLDGQDLDKQLTELEQELTDTQQLESQYKDKFPLLNQLKQGLEVLQSPLGDALDKLQEDEKAAREHLEQLRTIQEVLERLNESKDHFQYQEQVSMLDQEKSINQHTESQLSDIESKLSEVSKLIEQQAIDTQKAAETFHAEEGRLNTLKGQLELLKDNLSQAGASGAEGDLEQAQYAMDSLIAEKRELDKQLNQTKEKSYQLEAENKQLNSGYNKLNNRFTNQLENTRPVTGKWSKFHKEARNDAKYVELLDRYMKEIHGSEKQPEVFWRKVSGLKVTLIGSLEKIHDAKAVLERIKEITETDVEDTDQADVIMQIWIEIGQYIKQVIPVDLQTSNPEKAQEAIGQKLESLENNLSQQEHSLRIHVQSIPSHLNAEIRKQKSRIRKLNEKLDKVRFGFLNTIRIHIETQPKLKRFLDILPQQLDIFAETNEENVSIETLMADLYEKEGAGKVRGDLLMDYRHYVRLSIEVKREGNEDFEKVTSTNLSTGESIGVGIAILIMVLMSWEEQSHITQEDETRGSLRFLLLDESSRLDQNALHTLTDFCESLGLQLLIAAPSVERTLRGTTHHLTRGHFDGVEEVIVRGRRITAEPAAS